MTSKLVERSTEAPIRHRLHVQESRIDVRTGPYAALVLRIGLGLVFIAHALMKPLVFTMAGTAQFFELHGFPGWTAYPVFLAELVGGGVLVAGLFTRYAAAALVPIMAGAFLVHWPNGWSFTAPDGGWEYIAFLTTALVAQALLGDGAFAAGRRGMQPFGAHRVVESAKIPIAEDLRRARRARGGH